MKISTVENKLNKMNIEFSTEENDGEYTKIRFNLNGNSCSVETYTNSEEVSSICRIGEYNEDIQETSRSYFSTFKSLLRIYGVK